MAGYKGKIWRQELNDLMRGIAGAFLFGAPFLYTMEVWWKGNFTSPPRMMLMLGLAYFALVLLNIRGGFRDQQAQTRSQIMTESIEGLAIAFLTATLSLMLMGILRFETGLDAILGRIINVTLPFSIGVGVANNVLQRADEENQDADSSPKHKKVSPLSSSLSDIGATILGAIVIGSSIAPTDEIPMISSWVSPGRLLAIIASSLLLSYIIVFQANFGGQRRRRSQSGFFQSPMSETLVSYLLSLAVAMLMLWLFQIVRFGDPFNQWLTYTIVLGLPCTIGGAAGRLAV
ncbi:TIGR02587 family membrane protein [Leptolyngbya sp. AN02str]|uniref:TIGR02587 family membrane protein n=1 Tax=Leptolyngbya sp. AN02str TaxID=3423363 RepID=UPI003D31381B